MNYRHRLSALLLPLLFSLSLTAQMSETSSFSDIDTSTLDAAIQGAVARANASGATKADRKAAAAAYVERAEKYRDAGMPSLYKFALGDYRRALRYDPTLTDARAKMDEIVMIYESMGRPVPRNGLDDAAGGAATNLSGPAVTATTPATSQTAKRVRFRRGSNSAILKGAIVVGTEGDEYLIGARAGQRITLKISSVERNAVFDLYKAGEGEPREIVLEKKDWSGVLDEDGDYLIRVGSERGNAPYTLRVTIR